MDLSVYDEYIDVYECTRTQVARILARFTAAGAWVSTHPLRDVDTGLFFAELRIPEDSQRVLYLALRAKAKVLGCKVYLDVYTRKDSLTRYQYLRIKGANAHDKALARIADRLVNMKRIRSYTNVEPALSITLTGLGIVEERSRR